MKSSDKNILILTHWSFQDALIQAYTLPYVFLIRKNIEADRKIILVTFEQDHLKMDSKVRMEKVAFLRSKGIELLTLKYTKFNFTLPLKALGYFYELISTIKREKIGVIHAWCTPAGSMGYLLCKLTGCKLIIDSYEPHAEAMVENQTWKRNSLRFHLLFYLEKKLSRFAKILISATEGMREYARQKYNFNPQNFLVKPACVNILEFNRKNKKNEVLLNKLGLNNKIVAVYAGKFGGIYLTVESFHLLKAAENKWGENFRALLLTNHNLNEISSWAKEADFPMEKIICKFVSHEEISNYVGLGDFAITPVKPIPTKRYCSPIKDGEYWALGLPVIITKDISDDSEIISKENIGYVLQTLNEIEYKKSIERIDELLTEGDVLTNRIIKVAGNYRSFEIAEEVYKKIYKEDLFKST
ncbi:MAG: glycosyltransferase [Bacteroidetes bacterium]|nr:glycosyltransferase [Bacteroidota bacterium]